jgi:ribonuclease P protein component
LRPAQRLASPEVTRALKDGRLTRAPRLHLYTHPNHLQYARLALVVPKRLAARAVDRNRIRRIAREAFRLAQSRFEGYDMVIRLVRFGRTEPFSAAEVCAALESCKNAECRS